MFPLELPPQPPWEGLHPLVIHFPIALLFVTPVFVLLAGLLGKPGRWFGLTALILLVMGTVGGYVAVQTGDAAFDVLEEIDGDGWEVVEQHQDAAKKVTSLFVGLTVLYAVILALPLLIWKLNAWLYWFIANLVFLALLMVVNIQLANAAHLGGRLVHQYGARAVLGEPAEEAEAEETEEPVDEATEEPTEEAADESPEEPMDEPAGEPAAQPSDQPADEPAAQPSDEPMDEPSDETETSDEAAEPAETPTEEASPAEPEVEKPEAEPAPEEPAKTEAEPEAGEKEPAEKAATEGAPAEKEPADADETTDESTAA